MHLGSPRWSVNAMAVFAAASVLGPILVVYGLCPANTHRDYSKPNHPDNNSPLHPSLLCGALPTQYQMLARLRCSIGRRTRVVHRKYVATDTLLVQGGQFRYRPQQASL